MYIVCELCKSRSLFPIKVKSKLSYCWSNASYSEWLTHILSNLHQQNSLTRLHETLNVTRKLPLEDDDVEIFFYPQSSSILVHGKFPAETVANKTEFIGEFLQHGLITDVIFLSIQPETFYVLVFETKNIVQQLIKSPHYIANQQVKVEKFSYHKCVSIIDSNNYLQSAENADKEFSDIDSVKMDTDTSSISSDLSGAKSEASTAGQSETGTPSCLLSFPEEISFPLPQTALDAEFQTLMKKLGLTKSDIVKRRIVISKLENILKKDFPNCSVTPFGSTVTGLGTSKSNIDVSIDNICGDAPTPSDIEKAAEKIKNSLELSKSFVNVGIKMSIFRPTSMTCGYMGSELICDMSLSNEIGIQQTRLISFYLDFDTQVRLIVNTIKYWADFHQLTGQRGMTTYTISLLVLVFLTKMEIIPSVQALLSLHEKCKGKNCKSDKWDLQFCTDKMKAKEFMTMRDTYSFGSTDITALNILKLVKEFFDFCCRVDFSNNMICTLLCSAFPKSVFTRGKESDLPSTLGNYIKWANSPEAAKRGKINQPMHRFDVRGSFSIQDPFNLSLNISSETSPEVLTRFLKLCDQSSRSIDQLLNGKNGSTTLSSIFPQKIIS